jgi:O-antigen/teichoic acid export membrane protein
MARKTGSMLPRLRHFGWGVLDQGFSSATNFALSVVAGRLLGASGLGVVFIGFSACMVAVSFQRALVSDPLVVASAGLDVSERKAAARCALTMVVCGALAVSAVMLLLGLWLPGALGRGLIIFAPWVAGALLQDFWRSLLFRDGRGARAALNDGVWVAVMAVTLAVAARSAGEWSIAATWGAGASCAAVLGFLQTQIWPQHPGRAAAWWRLHAWPLGRWLTVENAFQVAGFQLLVFILALVLGAADLGGLRAVISLFAPMTLLGQALALPALPMLTREVRSSLRRARVRAVQLGAGALTLTLVYLLSLGAVRGQLLAAVFGPGFAGFDRLVLPIGVGNVVYAASVGFAVLLKADGRGRSLVLIRAIAAVGTLGLGVGLARAEGVVGAAVAIAAVLSLEAIVTIQLAFRERDVGLRARALSLP